eukprot:1437104-Pyramimonas_sp.AAC.2
MKDPDLPGGCMYYLAKTELLATCLLFVVPSTVVDTLCLVGMQHTLYKRMHESTINPSVQATAPRNDVQIQLPYLDHHNHPRLTSESIPPQRDSVSRSATAEGTKTRA